LPPETVIDAYALDPASIEPITSGHINRSFFARRTDDIECVLQRVNAIFPPEIHADIEAVTRHLKARGLVTPLLVPTREQRRYVETGGAVWRLLTRIAGTTREALSSSAEAREAGRVLGAFHRAVADFEQPLANQRPGVHDLPGHLARLRRVQTAHASHPAQTRVARLARDIESLAAGLAPVPASAPRLVHGDPKISNVIFEGDRAVCLIDLDTIGRLPIALELGDALRSWCNLAAEDVPEARISLERFDAALAGYRQAAGGLLAAAEWRAVPEATLAIAVELAARFAADALEESYFAWDRRRFASASAHNLARASAQLALAASIRRALPAMREIVVTHL
jgi:Ser/Thr protein kinase RdoA (MazF antagonist)